MSHRDYSSTVTHMTGRGSMKQREIKPFGLRMPPEVKAWIESQAEKEERSQNWLLVKIIKREMDRDEQQIKQA